MQGKWNVPTFVFWCNFTLFQLLGYNYESSRGFPECANMEKIAEHLKFWFQLVGGSLDNLVGWLSKLTRKFRKYVSSCSHTGCHIPCSYMRYLPAGVRFIKNYCYHNFHPQYQEPQILYDNANSIGFMFGYSTNAVTVKEEAYIYPLQSFVSEFGGSLGLFVGFSFLTIWDWILLLVKCFTLQCKQK